MNRPAPRPISERSLQALRERRAEIDRLDEADAAQAGRYEHDAMLCRQFIVQRIPERRDLDEMIAEQETLNARAQRKAG